jgi:HTH-type transcriptional regulator/antitoxin MqsA
MSPPKARKRTCPVCGKVALVYAVRDIEHTYRNETGLLPKVECDYCEACGESIFGLAESERVSAFMLNFNKDVNRKVIDPEFFARVRQKLQLDQQQADTLFCDGLRSFARYE